MNVPQPGRRSRARATRSSTGARTPATRMRWFTGSDAVRVYADYDNFTNLPGEPDPTALVQIRMTNGAIAQILLCYEIGPSGFGTRRNNQYTIVGTKGSVFWDLDRCELWTGARDRTHLGAAVLDAAGLQAARPAPDRQHVAPDRRRSSRTCSPAGRPAVTGEDGRAAIEMTQAAGRSRANAPGGPVATAAGRAVARGVGSATAVGGRSRFVTIERLEMLRARLHVLAGTRAVDRVRRHARLRRREADRQRRRRRLGRDVPAAGRAPRSSRRSGAVAHRPQGVGRDRAEGRVRQGRRAPVRGVGGVDRARRPPGAPAGRARSTRCTAAPRRDARAGLRRDRGLHRGRRSRRRRGRRRPSSSRRAGYTAIKMRIGRYPLQHERPLYEQIRRDLPATVDLMADGNGGYTLRRAIETAACSTTSASCGSRSRCTSGTATSATSC